MNLIKYSFLFLFSILGLGTLQAQKGSTRLEVSYTVGLPAGNLKHLVDETSFRGAEIGVLFGLNYQLSLGFQTGQQDFYQKFPRQVYHESGSDLSAVVTHSIQVNPIMAKLRYTSAGSAVQPFASLAAGANLVRYTKYYGVFEDGRSKIGFAAQPEIGVRIPFGAAKRSAFQLAAGYNYMPFRHNDADGLHHAVLKAGLSFSLK